MQAAACRNSRQLVGQQWILALAGGRQDARLHHAACIHGGTMGGAGR